MIFNADGKSKLAREGEEEWREGQRRGKEQMKMMAQGQRGSIQCPSNVFHEAATGMHEVEEVVEEVVKEFYHGTERVLQDTKEKGKAYVHVAVGAYQHKSCTQYL